LSGKYFFLNYQYDKQKEQIDNFVKKIIKREQEIENQTEKTDVFNERLKEFIPNSKNN
jgi:hypothetical protein